MVRLHRLFMLVCCVYSFAGVAADPTLTIDQWITKAEIAKIGESKVDRKSKIHHVFFHGHERDLRGNENENLWCRVDFVSDNSDPDEKKITITVGHVPLTEDGDFYDRSVASTLRMESPMFFGDLIPKHIAQESPTPDKQRSVKFQLETKDVYAVSNGFGFSFVVTNKAKNYDEAVVRQQNSLAVDTRIKVYLNEPFAEDDLPSLQRIEGYDLGSNNPYQPTYICNFNDN